MFSIIFKKALKLSNQAILYDYLKFIIIGMVRFIFTFSIYVFLLKFVHPVISITIVWTLAVPLTLFLHQRYVFKVTNNKKKMLFKYYLNYSLTYLINLITLYLAVDVLLLDPVVSQFVILIGLSVINFFFIRKIYKL